MSQTEKEIKKILKEIKGIDGKIMVALKYEPLMTKKLHKVIGNKSLDYLRGRVSKLKELEIIKDIPDGKLALMDYSTQYDAVEKVIKEYSKTHVIVSLKTISKNTGYAPDKIKDIAYELAYKHGISIGEEDVTRPAVF